MNKPPDKSVEADAKRMRWLLSGNGYFMEELSLCGHAPCDEDEQDDARKEIDEAIKREQEKPYFEIPENGWGTGWQAGKEIIIPMIKNIDGIGIKPGTFKEFDGIHDDGQGNLLDAAGEKIGTINYSKGVLNDSKTDETEEENILEYLEDTADGVKIYKHKDFPKDGSFEQGVNAAMSLYLKEREGGHWLPIGTAPKDGTEILIYGYKNIAIAKWNGMEWRDNGDIGWGGMYGDVLPTHWMPLPKPPIENKISNFNQELAVAGDFKRNCDGAPCPHCSGYADRVDATKDEVDKYQDCGRSFACCIDAFVCRQCGKRFIGTLEAPEFD